MRTFLLGAVLAVLLGLAGFIAAVPELSAAAKKAPNQAKGQESPRAASKSNAASKGTTPTAYHKSPHHNYTRWGKHTLRLGDRGLAVRGLQWMLTGTSQGPNVRPSKKACARCFNHSRRYWHVRTYKPTGRYARQTVLEVQTVKRRLGYPVERANGDAGPKLRLYLTGAKKLPKEYRDRAQKRYNVWHQRRVTRGPPWIPKAIRLANQAIAWSDHYFYTQTYRRSDFLQGIGAPWPKGGDCSGSVSAIYKLAGGPSTGSAFPYDWTGSMQDRGHVVWRAGESLTKLKPGDLVFYGYGAPFTHVAMVISKDGGRVYTFGSDACPCNSSTLYRSDARIARRYP